MINTILTAYDGSAPSRAAARLASACAARWNAKMVLCYALHVEQMLIAATGAASSSFDILEIYRRQSADLVEKQLEECRASSIDCAAMLRDEEAVEGILNGARDTRAQLIAIGTHARSGLERTFLGSVAEAVLRRSHIHVLTVHADTTSADAFKDILVAVDDSECAASALSLAAEIARTDGGTLHLLHVIPTGASRKRSTDGFDLLEALAKPIRATGATAYAYGDHGDPATTICAFANRIHAQLVVAGSHGRRGISRLVLGSVAEAVLRNTSCPVLVAK